MSERNSQGGGFIPKFKKFSQISRTSSGQMTEEDLSAQMPFGDRDIPQNPNRPSSASKLEKPIVDKKILPSGQNTTPQNQDKTPEKTDEKVNFIGKVAKFPKNAKASKAYSFLEKVKISKKSIWYILVEKQDDELQMVKYNQSEGVDINNFVLELKEYYTQKWSNNQKVLSLLENISIDGNDKFSVIKNIPQVEVDGKKMVTKITEDLIKLLAK